MVLRFVAADDGNCFSLAQTSNMWGGHSCPTIGPFAGRNARATRKTLGNCCALDSAFVAAGVWRRQSRAQARHDARHLHSHDHRQFRVTDAHGVGYFDRAVTLFFRLPRLRFVSGARPRACRRREERDRLQALIWQRQALKREISSDVYGTSELVPFPNQKNATCRSAAARRRPIP